MKNPTYPLPSASADGLLKEAIATRDKLAAQINTRCGLFGDTAAPSASLFPDDTFSTTEARRQIEILNQRIESLQQEQRRLSSSKATAQRENAGQICIF